MKKMILSASLLLSFSLTSVSAHAGLLDWLFGPSAPRTFKECVAAVIERDRKDQNVTLRRDAVALECKHMIRTTDDECEWMRLMDLKTDYEYYCGPTSGPNLPGTADLCEIFGCD